jgi:hypothetical protein
VDDEHDEFLEFASETPRWFASQPFAHQEMNMSDSTSMPARSRASALALLARLQESQQPAQDESHVDSCSAFGFVRGINDRCLAIEIRLGNGNSEFHSYALLSQFRFDPSVGILLRFSGDVITLVLLRGSNLDAPVRQNSVNLTDRGLQRHRVTFVREMESAELRKSGEKEPTIDRIDIAECESNEDVQAWLSKHAPAFLRKTDCAQ